MLRIKKDKNSIIKCAIIIAVFLLLFTVAAVAVVWLVSDDSEFRSNETLVNCGIACACEILIPAIISVLVLALSKKYYEITPESIKYYNGTQLIFELSKDDIIKMEFVLNRWVFFIKSGVWYLEIEYKGNQNIKPSTKRMTMEKEIKAYRISATYKQVVKISEILKMPIRERDNVSI